MNCPICEKRKPRRYCPARGDTICSICCGTEREVTIDCPSDCPHLVESRRRSAEQREVDWSSVPFSDARIPASFVTSHQKLLLALSYAVCDHARSHRDLTDVDVIGALQSLAQAYRTLSSGLYYEKPPDSPVQRDLYAALRTAIEDFRKAEAERTPLAALRDGEIRDALVFLTQIGSMRSNGRPKGRAYLDFLRSQFEAEEFAKPAPSIILAS